MTSPKLLAIGGAHIDRRGRCNDVFVPGVSNPGTMIEEVGGAAFNTARAAARLGTSVSMISARGGDAAGQSVAEAIKAAGISDLSVTHLDRATPSYTAILDHRGELAAALADMELYDTAFDRVSRRASTRTAVEAADAVLIDANLPQTAVARVAGLCTGKPLYANAISPAKALRLSSCLPVLACLFMNANEARAITGPTDREDIDALIRGLKTAGLPAAVITRGSAAIVGYDASGTFKLQPPQITAGDVTGAGDALAGAAISQLAAGEPLCRAARYGVAAACLAVASASATPRFSSDSLETMLQSVGVAQPLATAGNTDR